MAYIGPLPAETFTSFATQEFSTSATTSYTLDHAVTNENEIALFINNVRQQPGSGKAYTATGTALTLSAATASTDTMYAVFLGRALQTVNPADASVGTSQLAATSVTAAKLNNDIISGTTALAEEPADTDEFLVSDGGTIKRIDYSHIKGGGEKTLLATTTVSSAVSEVVFNNTYFTSTYRDYILTASQFDYSADSAIAHLNISSDNGSSYKSGSSHRYAVYGFEDTGGNISQSGTTDTKFEITSTPSSDADSRTTSFRLYIINPLDTSTYFSWYNYGFSHTAADRTNTFHGAGYFNDSAGDAFNAIKISASSGNIDQGVFKLYGVN